MIETVQHNWVEPFDCWYGIRMDPESSWRISCSKVLVEFIQILVGGTSWREPGPLQDEWSFKVDTLGFIVCSEL